MNLDVTKTRTMPTLFSTVPRTVNPSDVRRTRIVVRPGLFHQLLQLPVFDGLGQKHFDEGK